MVKESMAYQTILSMGFPAGAAREALHKHGGNLDRALDSLLSPQSSTPDTSTAANVGEAVREDIGPNFRNITERKSENILVSADVSQFTLANGRSACTCIALSGAALGLKRLTENGSTLSPPVNVFDVDFIQDSLFAGIGVYENRPTTADGVEHMSVEEVLHNLPQYTSDLKQKGEVRQGLISSNRTNESTGIKATLAACREEPTADSSKWMAVVMTKTPETVAIFLPPSTDFDTTESEFSQSYVLLDSHPRPNLSTKMRGSYAMICHSMDDLIHVLEEVFPITDLGAEVGEIMAMMYNSFDMYTFQLE